MPFQVFVCGTVPDPSKSSSSQRFPETEVADGLGSRKKASHWLDVVDAVDSLTQPLS